MARAVYTLVLAMLAPAFWFGLWRRSRREGGDWAVLSRERFGRYSAHTAHDVIWLHAVSLGETRAAKPLVDALLAHGVTVLLTHTTATARAEAARLFEGALARGQLIQQWLPYDFPGCTARFFAAYRPRVGILIEREVWPNLVAAARARRVPLVLVSARLSERSARTMQRWRWLMRPAFAGLTATLAQTPADAARLAECGARSPAVMGNLKFDLLPPASLEAVGREWRHGWRRPAIVIASTRDGEEAHFIRAVGAMRALPGNPLFVLVPRHPRRFDEVARELNDHGAAYARRSSLLDPAGVEAETRWLLGDSVGEMAAYYAAGDVAIIGGSFLDFGGQNLVEASAAGLPVIVGPYTRNFAQAADDAIAAGAARRVATAAEAIALALAWLDSHEQRQAMSTSARRFVAAHQGATARTMKALGPWL